MSARFPGRHRTHGRGPARTREGERPAGSLFAISHGRRAHLPRARRHREAHEPGHVAPANSDHAWPTLLDRLGNTDKLLILKKPFDNIEVRQLAAALTEKWELTKRARLTLEDLRSMVATQTARLEAANHQLEESNRAAQAATRAKSEFIANMSHELRTPMNGVVGMLGLLGTTRLDGEQSEYVEGARGSARHLLGLLDDILDLSRIEARKLVLEKVRLSVRDELALAVRALDAQAQAKGLVLSLRVAADVEDGRVGDPGRLRQIVVNLVGNAIKFSEHGEVTIDVARCAAEPTSLEIAVTDCGIGIAPEKLSSIFDAFTQADGSITRRYGGTGLGLSISAELVGMMGGRIWAESTIGEGATFRFTARLPPAADAVPSPSPRPSLAAPNVKLPAARPLDLLIADDSPVNLLLLSRLLEKRGHRVEKVVNGRLALEALTKKGFDALLLDVQMPELDGLEATRRIRAAEAGTGAHVPILMVTAQAMVGDEARCLEVGADGYVPKPIDPERLFATLDRLTTPQAPASQG